MHVHFVLCSIRVQHLGHHLINLDLVYPVLTKPRARSRMSYRPMAWMMIIYGLQLSIRHIHVSDGDLLWWLVLFLWLSTFTSFIIIMVLTWIGSLMYLCDGHIGCEYSFLVGLDILSPLGQLVFSFGQLQEIYGSFEHFTTDLPWEIKK